MNLKCACIFCLLFPLLKVVVGLVNFLKEVTFQSHRVSQDSVEHLGGDLLKGLVGGSKHCVMTLRLKHGSQTSSSNSSL